MPFVVAHRAGNDLARLRAAEAFGVALVEADLRLWRGRVEVRHLKTVGPIPILWDKWFLADPFAPRLRLEELLEAAAPATHLLLDLKGRDSRLAELVLEKLPPGRDVTVSARCARLLQPFVGVPGVRRFRSVGSRRQLRRLLARGETGGLDGLAIHERLLDESIVAAVRERVATVLAWPVNSAARAAELVRLGVDGLISDEPDRLVERAA